jgi:hypothetical protein
MSVAKKGGDPCSDPCGAPLRKGPFALHTVHAGVSGTFHPEDTLCVICTGREEGSVGEEEHSMTSPFPGVALGNRALPSPPDRW